jgi:beta-lactamase class D
MQSTVMPLLGFLALVAASVLNAGVARADDILERPDLVSVFQEQGAVGTFALYEAAADRTTVVDRQRAEARFAPASTFKIANSLIALETGVVHDENEIIPYGGKPQPIKAWEKEIARRVGMARYEQWLAGLDYGNRQLGTVVDRFWLDGPLAISAVEQARFAARLGQGTLPASERAQAIVRDILQLETVDGAVLFGKTGWLTSHSPKIGWWVGWIERNGEVVAFALNIDMATVDDAPKRIAIGKALLVKLGVL